MPSRPFHHHRSWFLSAVLLIVASSAFAGDTGQEPDRVLRRILTDEDLFQSAEFLQGLGVANGSIYDTTWVGHSSAGAGGAFLGVGVGGIWDFETNIAGTDSSQGWTPWVLPYRTGGNRPAALRPEWALDYGNNVNRGNTALWMARDIAGRKYVKTGVAGVWHADNMAGVKLNVSDGAEPSSTPISGARSAWCGIREPGNTHADGIDALTGNYLNGDLQKEEYGADRRSEYPGYSNLWDQMLYKDFSSPTGSGSVSFTYRTDLAAGADPTPGGSGWFHPDPTSLANFVNNTEDVFEVWAGSPTEVAYDTNRRWFSEVLDLSHPVQKLLAVTGKNPNTSTALGFVGLTPINSRIRIVFRVKTNRTNSDQDTDTVTGFNSKDGAALVDGVSVNGSPVEGFEITSQIRARSLIADIAAVGGPWAATGRPPGAYAHIENVLSGGLAYEDVNGGIGTPTRKCNLAGNVIVTGNHDDPNHTYAIESYQAIESPTIDLAVWSGPGGTKNGQGIDGDMASSTRVLINYDWYPGYISLDESVFHGAGVRYHGSDMVSPVSGTRQWSPLLLEDNLVYAALPECHNISRTLMDHGVPFGTIDSLRVVLTSETQGWRFGGTNLGNSRGGYFDNIRVGFRKNGTLPPVITPGLASVQGSPPGPGPAVQLRAWERLQDTFPFNESVTPGDHAGFDTTTALMVNGLNIVTPATDPGSVAGDSLIARARWTGDGVVTGTRVDLVFRIDPGPGSYSVKGNRASALVNRDPAHPFYAAYLASNGPFGTPGGHGGTWNKDVWNSCRMDSAEMNLHPINPRGINYPTRHTWMGTIHEGDPKYASLGISHNVCFLISPTGVNNDTNISCTGTVPAGYGAGVSGTTIEGTKILPDGWFTPGTHIEYYVRSSYVEDPMVADLSPNPDRVWPRVMGGFVDLDAERHASVDVLPDMWKSGRYGGSGLAGILLVDAADRRGSDRAYRGAADTSGYGKDNGATSGWRRSYPDVPDKYSDPNIVSDYILENRGQYGLSFDHFDVQGAEAIEGGRPGSRLAGNLGAIASKGAKCGPSVSMLNAFYNTIVWLTGDLNHGTVHDGVGAQEGADDLTLLQSFLQSATPANPRAVWLSGDGIVEDGAFFSPNLGAFLQDEFGALLFAESYNALTNDPTETAPLRCVAPWSLVGSALGFLNEPWISLDVLEVEPAAVGAQVGATYVDPNMTEYVASIWRDSGNARRLIDGFDLSHVRGNKTIQLSRLPQTRQVAGASESPEFDNDYGRLKWFDDVLSVYFGYTPRGGPVIAAGDIPGSNESLSANRLIGTVPNPSFAGTEVGIRFTLDADREVTVRFYSPSGREIARRTMAGHLGANRLAWDGVLKSGARAPAGVYFYRIEGLGDEAHGNRNRVVLLGP